MSTFAEHREVRVTARKSVTTPFVAPEMSPVRRVDLELDKGIPGWTDRDVKIETEGNGRPAGLSERRLEAMKVGTAVRKAAAPKGRVINSTGPSAGRRAMMARKGF